MLDQEFLSLLEAKLKKIEERKLKKALTDFEPNCSGKLCYSTKSYFFDDKELEKKVKEARENTKTLAEVLNDLMSEKGVDKNSDLYLKAQLDRKYFSKIVNNEINPSRDKIICIAIALELNITETNSLLKTLGYSLKDDSRDAIIKECLKRKYDLQTVDEYLNHFDEKLLVNYGI